MLNSSQQDITELKGLTQGADRGSLVKLGLEYVTL